MKPQRILGMAWTNMKKRKLRTALTTIGIVIGIMSLIGIATLSTGFETQMNTQLISGFDTDILTVNTGGGFHDPGGVSEDSGIELNTTYADAIETIDGIEVAMCIARQGTTAYNLENESLQTTIMGLNITKFELIYGDQINFTSGGWPTDNESIIIGYLDEPFAQMGENISVSIRIGVLSSNVTFTVSGILDEIGQLGMTSVDGNLLLPLDVYQTLLETETVDSIVVMISDPNQADTIADEIRTLFDDEVNVIVPSQMIETMQAMLTTQEIFLFAIASIAILVAGISILNIMLVSVMERTREIGILKALGAKRRTVLGQFLGEAVLLGILGGAFGIIFGYGMGFLLVQMLGPMFSQMRGLDATSSTIVPVLTVDTIIIALVFSILVSVIFTLYPAYKAAKLDPVKALRYE